MSRLRELQRRRSLCEKDWPDPFVRGQAQPVVSWWRVGLGTRPSERVGTGTEPESGGITLSGTTRQCEPEAVVGHGSAGPGG